MSTNNSNRLGPLRDRRPSSRLAADNNVALPALSSHRESIALVHAQRAHAAADAPSSALSTPGVNSAQGQPNEDDGHSDSAAASSQPITSTISWPDSVGPLSDSSERSLRTAARTKKRKRGQKNTGTRRRPETNEDGMYKDVNIMEISSDDQSDSRPRNKRNPTADIEQFFEPAKHVKGDKRGRRRCKACMSGDGGCSKADRVLVDEHSTLRRHLASLHKGLYKRWCKSTSFLSMLPDDAKARRREALEIALEQTQVDDHFHLVKPEDKPEPYSDNVFKKVAIQWLIETDQPIAAFEHPSFQRMVHIASRATRSINIPNKKQARDEIISLFKDQMNKLKQRLNSQYVAGEVSLTCDAWQASNTDGYFAVTGHWIEERSPGRWTLENALLGFTRMNTAHNGDRLGQALFKICHRLNVVHKIGHITCDNASNNNTMMKEFARCYKGKTGQDFDVKKRHIRCLAHIINLATQALISTRSKAKYYDPHNIDDHMPDVNAIERDELGLVRGISVKERSSAQRKDLFKSIQARHGVKNPVQLLLDMKVRWGSTYVMLNRSDSNKKFVNEFVYELGVRTDNLEARKKIDALMLSDAEWDRVGMFCALLSHADKAQQAFSSVQTPTLFNAIPAIETLHAAWASRAEKNKYRSFKDALNAATAKLNAYYEKTADSDAHILAMLLHPERKMGHFEKYWDKELCKDVLTLGQEAFKNRYEQLKVTNSTSSKMSTMPPVKRWKTEGLLREADSDDSDSGVDALEPSSDPWMIEFNQYIKTNDIIPPGMAVVVWWGLNAPRYPIGSSLARDYLAVMASSVSSERAFSSAGLTISKRCNRLKGDIVEALQCLKCMYHNDLIFQDVVVATEEEEELEDMDLELAGENGGYNDVEEGLSTWDELLADDEDLYENTK